jgi:RNA methyltransferase, TrmH family
MTKTIKSLDNPIIKHIVKLHTAKYRTERQQFIAEGFRTIATIIKAGQTPTNLFTTEEFLYDAQQLVNEKLIIVVTPAVMNKISTVQSPSGLLATFSIPPQPSLSTLSFGVVLAQVTDPGNMGTLIRTAAAMNKKTVVCVETVDPWNPKVIQASAGAITDVSIFRMSWTELMHNKKNIPLHALVASEGKHPSDVNLRDALLVVGSESHGIPQDWVEQCDEKITLPMPGNFESLNAAVAGSIALYLAATQHK